MNREGRMTGTQEGPNGDGGRSDNSSEVGSEIHVADSLPTHYDNDGKITAAGVLLMVHDDHDGSRASGQEVPLHVPPSLWKKQVSLPTATKESLVAMTLRLRSDSILQSDDIVFCLNHHLGTARNAMRSARNSLEDCFGEFKLFDPGFPFHESDQDRLDHPKALPRHLLFIFDYENHWTLGHLDCEDRVMRNYDSCLSYGVDRWESIQQRMREWTNAHSLVPNDTLQLIQPEVRTPAKAHRCRRLHWQICPEASRSFVHHFA